MATDPNVTAIANYAGKYERKLFSTLVNMLDVANDVDVLAGIKNKLNLTKLKVTNGARPYKSVLEAEGDQLNYTGRVLEVQLGKREIQIDPIKYRDTWQNEVLRPGVNPKDIPFAAYVWDQVVKQLAAELNDETTWYGFDKTDATAIDAGGHTAGDYILWSNGTTTDYYLCVTNAGAGETPGTHAAKWQKVNARAITEGYAKLLADAVTASDITPIATGAVTATAGVARTAFKKLFRACDTPYKRQGVIIHCSYTDFELLLDDIEDISKYTRSDVTEGGPEWIYLPGSNRKCIVKPASWMGTSRRLVATPMEMRNGNPVSVNLLMGTDLLSDAQKILTDEGLYRIDAAIVFAICFQIRDLDAIWIGDQT